MFVTPVTQKQQETAVTRWTCILSVGGNTCAPCGGGKPVTSATEPAQGQECWGNCALVLASTTGHGFSRSFRLRCGAPPSETPGCFLPVGRSGPLSAAGILRSRPQRGFPLWGENQSPMASWDSWQETWVNSSSHFPKGKGSTAHCLLSPITRFLHTWRSTLSPVRLHSPHLHPPRSQLRARPPSPALQASL